LRLEILWTHGGIYVDVDYLCVAPLSDLPQRFDFVCGASNTGCVEINNGLLGCVPNHPLIRLMMEGVHDWFRSLSTRLPLDIMASFLDGTTQEALLSQIIQVTPTDVIRHTGPGLVTRTLGHALLGDGAEQQHAFAKERVAVLPYSVFHPLPNSSRRGKAQRDEPLNEEQIEAHIVRGETRAVHLWQCSWQQSTSL